MYTYTAIFGKYPKEIIARHLSAARRAVCDIMPTPEIATISEDVFMDGISGGWTKILPKSKQPASLLQDIHDDDISVLVHGRISSECGSAECVAAAYRQGGIEAVRALDGAFLSIIADYQNDRVVFCTDLIGHMAAHFLIRDGVLFVSPHDVGLVAASDCSLDIDATSVLSMILFDWSIGGHPMLADAQTTSSRCWYEWRNNRLFVHEANPFPDRKLIQKDEKYDATSVVTETIEHLVTETRHTLDSADQAVISLTGGMDSRLLLALIKASQTQTPLLAYTSGTPWSMDVVLAKMLSKIVNIPHVRSSVKAPEIDDFMSEANLYAFHFNGDTSVKRATRKFRMPPGEIRLTGGAGEIYRGYYYGLAKRNASLTSMETARQIWGKIMKRRSNIVDIVDNTQLDKVSHRLDDIFSDFEPFAASTYDLLDYYYLFERYARWGSLVTRRVWADVRSPLACPSAIRAAFKLPSPIGEYCTVHKNSIALFLPNTGYWLPINMKKILPLGSHPLEKPIAKLGGMLERRLRRLDTAASSSRDAVFSGPLFHVVRDLLSRSDGICATVFGTNSTVKLLEAFRQAPAAMLEPVTCLLSAEIWLQQLKMAKATATSER